MALIDPLSLNSSFYRQCIFLIFSSIVFFIVKNIPIKVIHDNSTLIFISTLILCTIPFFLPRVEYTYTEFDDISVTTTSNGSASVKKSADANLTTISFSVAKSF